MFFAPKLPGGDTSLIAAQLRALSDKIDATNSKIDTISANYITRQDMGNLQQTIENRFMERAVADQKFDNISERLGKIEKQLETASTIQSERGFITRNNLVYWVLGVPATLYILFNMFTYLVTHLKP